MRLVERGGLWRLLWISVSDNVDIESRRTPRSRGARGRRDNFLGADLNSEGSGDGAYHRLEAHGL